MGDQQIYQIFQEGYHRAASGSPLGPAVLPPTHTYNGSGYPPALTPINDFNTPSHNFIQGNGWPPYPGSELDFPASMINRNGYTNQHQQQGQQQQQPGPSQQQLYQEFYGNGPLEATLSNFASYPSVPGVPTPDLMMQPDPFGAVPGACLDYNPPSVYPGGANPWPKQELQNGYQPRSVLEQEDVKGIFIPTQETSHFFPSNSEGLSDPVSPSDSQPASPRSPMSVGASSVTDTKRKSGAGGKAAAGAGTGRGKRKKTDDVVADPHVRLVKERDRRVSNNSRERMRIRDINDALTELGRVCMSLRPMGKANAEKPQTKLGVLNMAVDVIMQLEKKVRDRNLNPSTVALHHRTATAAGSNPATATTSGSMNPFQSPPPPTMQQRWIFVKTFTYVRAKKTMKPFVHFCLTKFLAAKVIFFGIVLKLQKDNHYINPRKTL